jgi:phenylalanyl-tRNA synthetase beta chain
MKGLIGYAWSKGEEGLTRRVRGRSDGIAAAPRYLVRVVSGVNNRGSSPVWLQERLRRSDIRPLSPLVDITNYLLLELGQPMHAFDRHKIGEAIVVREAEQGEQITLLNGETITLNRGTLLIADNAQPLALAGIMGGASSAVSSETTTIVLEAAFFSPAALAGEARRYGLHTDSSHRFERGVDPAITRTAMERATALILEICGGEAASIVEVTSESHLPQRASIMLRPSRIETMLGVALSATLVANLLQRLGMQVVVCGEGWQVTPPSWRFDIALEIDLIEELARLYGYDNIPSQPPQGEMTMVAVAEATIGLPQLRQRLVDRGYHEAITYSFVDPALQRQLVAGGEGIRLQNPISSDLAEMRLSLWPGLINALRHNLNRQQPRVRLFESGLRFLPQGRSVDQQPMIAGVIYGSCYPEQWGVAARVVDFFDLKGDVEALLPAGVAVEFVATPHPVLHPGRSAELRLDGVHAGWLGALHPQIESALDLSGVYLFEIALSALTQAKLPHFAALSRFPAIRRDLAFVVKREVAVADFIATVRRVAPETLREVVLFDLYQGEHIDTSSKSIAFGITLQAQSRTLIDAEVEQAVATIVAAVAEKYGATLRE